MRFHVNFLVKRSTGLGRRRPSLLSMSHPDRFAPPGGVSRNAVIVGSVVALHVAGIWALQSGQVRKAAEVIVAAELLSEFIAPPAPPKVTPPPPAPPPQTADATALPPPN